MNRRDLLKAILASPIAAAAGAAFAKTAKVAPVPVFKAAFKPTGDFTVWESLRRAPEAFYSTTAAYAPEIGQEVVIERDGAVLFTGKVNTVTRHDSGLVDVCARGPQPEITSDYYSAIYGINYPGESL